MSLNYQGSESPVIGAGPATSVDDVADRVRDTVKGAISAADLSIEGIEEEVGRLCARRDRLVAHRMHLNAWLEAN